MNSDLIRVRDFCKRYAVSRSTFYRLVQRGQLQIYKIGSATRISKADAEAWVASVRSDAA